MSSVWSSGWESLSMFPQSYGSRFSVVTQWYFSSDMPSIAEQVEIAILPARTRRLGPRKGAYGYVPQIPAVVRYEFESFLVFLEQHLLEHQFFYDINFEVFTCSNHKFSSTSAPRVGGTASVFSMSEYSFPFFYKVVLGFCICGVVLIGKFMIIDLLWLWGLKFSIRRWVDGSLAINKLAISSLLTYRHLYLHSCMCLSG